MSLPDEFPMVATTWWSFGRNRRMLSEIRDELNRRKVDVIDIWSDPDLNRTMVAFEEDDIHVAQCVVELAQMVLPSIDLRRHSGTHPRTGALDLVRFSPLTDEVSGDSALKATGDHLSTFHQLPIFADGPDSDAASERRILDLRQGGFGSLGNKNLEPDFGPPVAHPQWGVTTILVGHYQLYAALELHDPTTKAAGHVAEQIENLRMAGDSLLLGVTAEGFARPSHEGSLLLLTFEMPDDAYPDQVLKVIEKEARLAGAGVGRARALGIWRASDLAKATRLRVDKSTQVWDDIYC